MSQFIKIKDLIVNKSIIKYAKVSYQDSIYYLTLQLTNDESESVGTDDIEEARQLLKEVYEALQE